MITIKLTDRNNNTSHNIDRLNKLRYSKKHNSYNMLTLACKKY